MTPAPREDRLYVNNPMQLADYKDLFIRLKDGTDITHDATSDCDLPFKKVAKCSQRPKAVADDLTNREHGQLGSRQAYPTSKTLGSDGSGISSSTSAGSTTSAS